MLPLPKGGATTPSMPLLLLRPLSNSNSWVSLRPTEIGGKSSNDEAKDEAGGVSPAGSRVDDTDSLEEDGRSEDDVERCIPASGDDEDEPEGATEEPKRRRVVSEPALCWGDPAAASVREAPLVKVSAAAIEPDEAATASSRASDAMSSSPILEASLCVQVR